MRSVWVVLGFQDGSDSAVLDHETVCVFVTKKLADSYSAVLGSDKLIDSCDVTEHRVFDRVAEALEANV